MGETRKLAAILVADVVGYSRLAGLDEERTVARLRGLRRDFIDPSIAAHRGRIVKTTGDGVLVEFASAVDAVRGAVVVQRSMAKQNTSVPQGQKIEFRIGIHVGDVIIDDSDLFGDGVNIAARLEGIAQPGGICLSGAAYDQVRDKLPFSFVDLGDQTLKNIARAVRVYGIAAREMMALAEPVGKQAAAGDAVDSRSGASGHSPGERAMRPSLAVLPFDNLSRDTEMGDFCDGLAEDATTALSRFRWLNVVSRNSSFAQKGRSFDIRKIADDLGARFVLEGSVRKSGARIRVTAQLIDGISGNHLWADRYDREYSAVFDLQDEVVRDIVASLEYALWITLVRGDVCAPNPVNSPLRAAGWHIAECTRIGNRTAIATATRALEINPKSVAAYQYLANAYIVDLIFGWTEDESDVGNLQEAARRAISLSPADYLSRGLYAVGLAFAGDHDEALSHARRALALNSNSINVLGPCGNVLSFSGEAREANEMLERMLRLAPAHYFRAGFLSQMALNWLCLGEPERGALLASEALKLKPEAICCHIIYAKISASLGRRDAAKAAVSDVYRYRPDLNRALIDVMFPHRNRSIPGQFAELLEIT